MPAGPSPFPQPTRLLPLGRLTCCGGRGCSGGEGEGCRGEGSRTFHGPPGDGPVVSADSDQAGTEPVGCVVDDVSIAVTPALIAALAGWGHGRSRVEWSPSPQPLTNPAPPYPQGCVCTGCRSGCSHWEGEREGLRACRGQAAPTSPAPAPPTLCGPLPALAVLRGGDTGAHIIVVPILAVAAALGHTLHLVFTEEWLAGRTPGVAS